LREVHQATASSRPKYAKMTKKRKTGDIKASELLGIRQQYTPEYPALV
jgi:hypothetical protein